MQQSEKVKRFWSVGYKLFNERFVRYMGRYKCDIPWYTGPAEMLYHSPCTFGSQNMHIISSNLNEKFTKSEIRSSWSQFKHCSESLIWLLGSHIWSLLTQVTWKIVQNWNLVKFESVETLLRIAQLSPRNSHIVIIAPVHMTSWPKSN